MAPCLWKTKANIGGVLLHHSATKRFMWFFFLEKCFKTRCGSLCGSIPYKTLATHCAMPQRNMGLVALEYINTCGMSCDPHTFLSKDFVHWVNRSSELPSPPKRHNNCPNGGWFQEFLGEISSTSPELHSTLLHPWDVTHKVSSQWSI